MIFAYPICINLSFSSACLREKYEQLQGQIAKCVTKTSSPLAFFPNLRIELMGEIHINSCCPKYRGTMLALASQLCQDVELAGSTAENCLDAIGSTIGLHASHQKNNSHHMES